MAQLLFIAMHFLIKIEQKQKLKTITEKNLGEIGSRWGAFTYKFVCEIKLLYLNSFYFESIIGG